MSTHHTTRTNQTNPISILSICTGFLLAIIIGLFLLGIGYSVFYSGKVFPGVGISGVDIGNLSTEEAAAKLTEQIQYSTNGKIIFSNDSDNWMATPQQLGYYNDLQASATQAYQYGRSGWIFTRILDQLRARFWGINLPLQMVNDQKIAQDYMLQIASEIEQPVREASLQVNGTEVVVQSGQPGKNLDVVETMALVQQQFANQQDGIIPIVVRETSPYLLDLSTQAEMVKNILSTPLVIYMPVGDTSGFGPWAIGQEDLAKMLVFTRVTENDKMNISVQINQELMRAFLQNLVPVINQDALNARFIFNDDLLQLDLLEHAQVGRSLDLEKSLLDVVQKVMSGEHQATLTVNIDEPEASDSSTGKELGVTELVHQETSYFYGSNSSRVNNIRTAASRFHGLLVPPGGILSMADEIGDISLDSGYSEAIIIYGNQSIKGVGGGVCQVSTTLFRAAFFAGFPILERVAHAYRVGYYEQTASGAEDPNLAGLDATVFVPVVDMKFKNDTPYWLLMETYTTDSSITWKFYSSPDGRSVDWDTTGPENIVKAPEAKYVENKDRAEGEIKQIDWSADGADISVNRTVYKDGQVYFKDNFQTHYVPWQAVFEYGPGTKLPKKAKGNEG